MKNIRTGPESETNVLSFSYCVYMHSYIPGSLNWCILTFTIVYTGISNCGGFGFKAIQDTNSI